LLAIDPEQDLRVGYPRLHIETVSPVRTVLEAVLPLRITTVEAVLAWVAWIQQRTHQAYLAHRKRRETES
jgi:hypothetical protein